MSSFNLRLWPEAADMTHAGRSAGLEGPVKRLGSISALVRQNSPGPQNLFSLAPGIG